MYWVDVVRTTLYILNKSPIRSLENITPYEACYQKKPNVNDFKVFGCKAFSHVVDEQWKKLDAKSEVCVFIGYCEKTKAYRLYNPKIRKVIMSQDVIFDEGGFYGHQILYVDDGTSSENSSSSSTGRKT